MTRSPPPSANVDRDTVAGFGEEWAAYDQTALGDEEYGALFAAYFGIFPFADLPDDAEGFDLGCGSGRWAAGVAPRVGLLHCIDPAEKALDVARRRLAGAPNVRFHHATADTIPLPEGSQDFGYSLGVLHHIPDTGRALADCVRKLKPGAPFLVYLYYRLDGRPMWFRALWRASDVGRRMIFRLPFAARGLPSGSAPTCPACRSAPIATSASTRCGPTRSTGSGPGSSSASPAPKSAR